MRSVYDFLMAHPIFIAWLTSGMCLISSRQDARSGDRGEAIFWYVLAVFAMVGFVIAMLMYKLWFNLLLGLATLAFELWLAKQWWWSGDPVSQARRNT